ncbi:TetR/AcrR family transcriptional regulator [Paenibacillus radicis (ex Xue et al. 2023)]|uniref:TetR/AcrR family transcriptional regulator n=1 Tax=Paenibacillus radicis (ex Xue et al. 2023) TaxID=2972489 RepID=A0ABT1YVD4_9BACL|nr:TetR/AcrR family transcriptional regulator [Paenibacillus radicis (ex Xue et al. 2023)]MCR8636910.1 TetR/AcrR family transcriptional regulator [Paenibacillus radicis (ex Xue et al. 2023)]
MESIKKSKQELRSEETKRSIAEAAGNLFTERGYDTVTMREIAKEANCSHTTIYLYFKDKEALLEQLAIPPLQTLEAAFLSVMNEKSLDPTGKLLEISRHFLRFCLSHKSMVTVIFNVKSVRVDEVNPAGEVNQLRNRLFSHLTESVNRIIPAETSEARINHSRVYFFVMNGMVSTYLNSEEPLEPLLERIIPLLDQSIEIVLLGIKHKLEQVQNPLKGQTKGQKDKEKSKKDKKQKVKKSKIEG